MQCPNCGAPIEEEDQACRECGFLLSTVESSGESRRVPHLEDQPTELDPAVHPLPPPAPTASRWSKAAVLRVGIVLLLLLSMGGGLFWWGGRGLPATGLPVGRPDSRVLVYADNFDDPASGWDVTSDNDGSAMYADGEYRVAVYNANSVGWGNPAANREFSDLHIVVEARQAEGPTDGNYGVLVRYQGEDQFYWFQVSGNGLFTVALRQADGWKQLVDWQASSAIHKGIGATNRLEVVCIGSQYSFYVNGVHLTDVTDSTLSGGNIGLAVGTFNEPGVIVNFDNLGVFAATE